MVKMTMKWSMEEVAGNVLIIDFHLFEMIIAAKMWIKLS